MYQALYRKWRPTLFADVIGQQHITDTLRNQIQSSRTSHAYLFTGTRGTGKTSCAKILARALNCEHPNHGDPCNACPSCLGILDGSVLDVLEIDAASNNGVDNIRDIREESQYQPVAVKKRVYIIDEVHMLSQGAFNALLKTLEEPPGHVVFILATTEIQKVPSTIVSRCQRFDFHRISVEDIAHALQKIAEQEGIHITNAATILIARLADGAMRDALSILDRTATLSDAITEDTVAQATGILEGDQILEWMDAIACSNLQAILTMVARSYDAGIQMGSILEQLLQLTRDMLLYQTVGQDAEHLISPAYSVSKLQTLSQTIPSGRLLAYANLLQDGLVKMKSATQKRMELEFCLIRLCHLQAEDYETLSDRMDALASQIEQMPAPPRQPIRQEAPSKKEAETSKIQLAEPAQKPEKQEATPPKEWALWAKYLQALTGKISTAAHANLKLSAKASMQQNTLSIYADDDITAMLIEAPPTRQMMEKELEALMGTPCVLQILRPSDAQAIQNHSEIDEILEKARAMDVPVLPWED